MIREEVIIFNQCTCCTSVIFSIKKKRSTVHPQTSGPYFVLHKYCVFKIQRPVCLCTSTFMTSRKMCSLLEGAGGGSCILKSLPVKYLKYG